MVEEFCPECGAKITGSTGFCPECGAVTTSLNNQIKETKRLEREERERRAEHNRQVREKRLNFIKKNKYYIFGILIFIIVIVAVVNIMDSLDTSNRVYACDEYSLEYPHNYTIGRDHTEGSTGNIFTDFENQNSEGEIKIAIYDNNGYSLSESKKNTMDYYDSSGITIKDKGTKTIDGVEGYVLEYEGHWIAYNFIKGDKLYVINFVNEDSYNDIDAVLDSFKFK